MPQLLLFCYDVIAAEVVDEMMQFKPLSHERQQAEAGERS